MEPIGIAFIIIGAVAGCIVTVVALMKADRDEKNPNITHKEWVRHRRR
jgi:hypothetical protein